MGRKIDCRGFACPQPVLETKKALEASGAEEILVLVDNPSSKENVRRFAESQGHRVSITEEKGVFELRIQKGKGKSEPGGGENRREPKVRSLRILWFSSIRILWAGVRRSWEEF